MLWWEARIKLDEEDYRAYVTDLPGLWQDVDRGYRPPGCTVAYDAERYELMLMAEKRESLVGLVEWLMRGAQSAQIHLEHRCYATRDVPASPWAGPCDCRPSTHSPSPQTERQAEAG